MAVDLAKPNLIVAVFGAGTMGRGIAQVCAQAGVTTLLFDSRDGAVKEAIAAVDKGLEGLVAKQRMTPAAKKDVLEHLKPINSLDEAKGAGIVIEAIVENLAAKRALFRELEKRVSAVCVLATNTSSLSVTEMAAGLAHPERVVGFHLFNTVAVLPLVEVVRGSATGDAAVATALAVGKTLGKSCVIVADQPAFVVNRLLTRFLGEIIRAVDEGTPFEIAEHAADSLGLPMTPFLLLQLVGPAVALHVGETLNAAFPDRFTVSPKLRELVASGKTAVYLPDFTVGPEVAAILAGGDHPSNGPETASRALEGLAQEIRIMLDEGVVAAPEDIDLCMILGAGWPFHLGGITPYLDRTGIAAKVTGAPFRGEHT